LGQRLKDASAQRLPTGVSKARGLLERLLDHVPELSAHTSAVYTALLSIGDELLVPWDTVAGAFDFGNESRITNILYRLLEKIPQQNRLALLTPAFQAATALRCAEFLLSVLNDEAQKAAAGGGDSLLTAQEADTLKPIWRALVEQQAQSPDFINNNRLGPLVTGWREWGGETQAKAWAQQVTQSDDALIKFVTAFASQTTSHASGDYAVHVAWKVKPASLEPYIDLEATANRLEVLSKAGIQPEKNAEAVKDFLRRWKQVKAGKPDNDFFGANEHEHDQS
jgi:hypothetical protein